MVSPSHTHASSLGAIRLVRGKRRGALTYVQRGGNQSTVDRDGRSLDTYAHAIYDLVLQTSARAVLMIGCGGGVLGTMLADAGKRVTIVDVDPVSFKLARRYFGLSRDIACHVADGLAFMQATRRRFDVVIVDAFVGERMPRQFLSDDFSAAARECLRSRGVMFVNICLGRGQDTADRLAARLVRNGWKVRLLDRRRAPDRNAILMAGEVRELRRPKLRLVPRIEAERLRAELKAMYFRRRRAIRRRKR